MSLSGVFTPQQGGPGDSEGGPGAYEGLPAERRTQLPAELCPGNKAVQRGDPQLWVKM